MTRYAGPILGALLPSQNLAYAGSTTITSWSQAQSLLTAGDAVEAWPSADNAFSPCIAATFSSVSSNGAQIIARPDYTNVPNWNSLGYTLSTGTVVGGILMDEAGALIPSIQQEYNYQGIWSWTNTSDTTATLAEYDEWTAGGQEFSFINFYQGTYQAVVGGTTTTIGRIAAFRSDLTAIYKAYTLKQKCTASLPTLSGQYLYIFPEFRWWNGVILPVDGYDRASYSYYTAAPTSTELTTQSGAYHQYASTAKGVPYINMTYTWSDDGHTATFLQALYDYIAVSNGGLLYLPPAGANHSGETTTHFLDNGGMPQLIYPSSELKITQTDSNVWTTTITGRCQL